jgi:CRISPR-associated protein Cmr2
MLDTFVADLNKTRAPKLDAHMTLSVGIAIGHFLENLEDLRQYGQAAEKHAKQPDPDGTKNSLAVHLYKRGGSPIVMRAKWTENPDTRLDETARLFLRGALPGRLPYDLRRMADVYRNWSDPTVGEAIRQDVLRLVAAKVGDRMELDRVAHALRERVNDAESLLAFAAELLVARQISVSLRQAGERTEGAFHD